MEFDNICKLICSRYPEQYAAWKSKDIVTPVTVWDKELNIEPIHADSVIFLQTQNKILHFEFQVEVEKSDPPIPLRMLDYWVRLHRYHRLPVEQVLVLLKNTPQARELKSEFHLGKTSHYFHVVRLWEEDPETLLQNIALLPLAVLSKTQNPVQLLNRVVEHVKKIDNINERNLISDSTQILAGLRYEAKIIHQTFKEGIMRESVIYQEIHQEGLKEGKKEGMQQGLQQGMKQGMQQGRHEEGIFIVSRFLQRKFGEIDPAIHEQIQRLSVDQLEELAELLFDFQEINDLKTWLRQ